MGEPLGNPLYELATRASQDELVPVPDELTGAPAGCLLDTLGIKLTHVGVGRARAEMVVSAVHLNQRGHTQGGVLVAFGDAAAGWASDGTLPDGGFTTLEMKCNLLKAITPGANLVATAIPVHLGHRSLVHDVDVVLEEKGFSAVRAPVAHFSCTQLVLSAC